jgi:cytoskeletal protein CcmA (bactofilin family)
MVGRDARDADIGGQQRMGGPVPEERRVAAWIGASIVIKGDVTSSEDMTIAGQVEGDVVVKEHALVIAPQARIRGNIVARAVAIRGQVLGTITAERKVEVGETGSVEGDINTPRLVVAEGAVIHGRVGTAGPAARRPGPTGAFSGGT